MKKSLLVLALAAAFAPALAQAEAGDWVVRIRAVDVSPNEDSKLGQTVAKNVAPGLINTGANLSVDSNVIPELDISYYFTKNIAAELILALGSRHDVSVTGAGSGVLQNQKLGSVNLLPPTLTAQWHFMPDQTFDPYIGAGVNYTNMLDRNLQFSQGITGTKIKIDRDSFGLVAQAGFDINLKDGWLINADVKYAKVDTDVKMNFGGNWIKIDSLDIDPWVFGIGIGKKF
ncbi:MAG: outer membrane beta-barrel protein [Methylotenera sp.]|uniref:OmpW/AlkL family protein n=1 Tax=Methylotenera sp. TaxID=2051956 RepID=UPI0024879221|nr:OmpW family outer membrane protein [Methylotenera sp.]MDI1308359.1 outer membrane beta-barrel protein [Methylotenera sp.]